ncbi:MAG TPA: GvpL/GvpF family gas vesicle protein [Mycobacteriales bacterium]|nr:GvpL/GvpF family gas vesicle protein [Mycobacteriales bacterium]
MSAAEVPDASGLVRPEDVESLLADVRTLGLQLARARLVESYAAALVRAVTTGAAPDGPEQAPNGVSFDGAAVASAPEPSSATGCYVYAVVAGDGTGAAGVGEGIEPGGPVRVVTVGGISAVVSDVDLDAMREGGSCDEIAEDGWLANAVRAHERVVLAAFRSAPTVPMRFGIVHPDQASVERLLDVHAEEFDDELRRVTAAAEWSVRVYVDPDIAATSDVEGAGDGRDAHEAMDGVAASSGTTYLLRERERRRREERLRSQVQRSVDELTSTLSDVARGVVVTPQIVTDDGRAGVFSAAYLVDRCDEHRLVAVVDAFNESGPMTGVTVDVAGPWPPYHFTTLRLEADDE